MSTNIEHMTWTPEISDDEFYYWSVPFRGKFVRAVLAYVAKTWAEGGDDTIERLMRPDQNLSSCNAYIHVTGDRQPVISHEPPQAAADGRNLVPWHQLSTGIFPGLWPREAAWACPVSERQIPTAKPTHTLFHVIASRAKIPEA